MQTLSLDAIKESPFNPRKDFDRQALAELAADIERHGVLQPARVRPVEKGYELVFGHRRYRAAKMAGLTEMPVVVSKMTDAEALEHQLVENLKRSDLHPLEVAAGYKRLIDEHGATVEQLAERVGRAESTVRETLKLNDLADAPRKAFLAGELVASIALLIARIQPDSQAQATKELRDGRYGRGGPMSVVEAREWIAEKYQVDLRKAVFELDDAELLPEAGACKACPKRLSNAGANTCTDPGCYQSKVDAHLKQQAAARGVELLNKKEAAAVFGTWGSRPQSDAPYVRADQKNYDDEKTRTWSQLIGKKEAHALTVLAKTPDGEVVELLKKDGLKAALKASGKLQKKEKAAKTEKADPKLELRQRVVPLAVAKVVERIEAKGLSKRLLLLLAKRYEPDIEDVHQRRWGDAVDIQSRIEKLSAEQLLAYIFESVLAWDLYAKHSYSEVLTEACDALGVDLKKLEAEVKATPASPWKQVGDVFKATINGKKIEVRQLAGKGSVWEWTTGSSGGAGYTSADNAKQAAEAAADSQEQHAKAKAKAKKARAA